jgi:hypothetical protein
MSTDQHAASCCCKSLGITVTGDPDLVAVCNCTQCQRRTGSPFGVGAYYKRERVVAIKGESALFTRMAESGRHLTFHFCPNCGTSVYWTLEMRPDHFGIAAGCFDDPGFLHPTRVVWAQHKHAWVQFPEGLSFFPQAAT